MHTWKYPVPTSLPSRVLFVGFRVGGHFRIHFTYVHFIGKDPTSGPTSGRCQTKHARSRSGVALRQPTKFFWDPPGGIFKQ